MLQILENSVPLWVRRPQKNCWWDALQLWQKNAKPQFFYNVNSVENSGEILVHHILCVYFQCCHETSLYIMSFALGKSLIYGFVSIIDAQVFWSVLRQPVGHQESLCWVLHDGLQFHLSRGATCKFVTSVYQPHQWPVTMGKTYIYTMLTEKNIYNM